MHKEKLTWILVIIVLALLGYVAYTMLMPKTDGDSRQDSPTQKLTPGYDVEGASKRVTGEK